jgi:hypothetical protein
VVGRQTVKPGMKIRQKRGRLDRGHHSCRKPQLWAHFAAEPENRSRIVGIARMVVVRRSGEVTQSNFIMARPYRRRTLSSVSRAYSSDPFERIAAIGGSNSDGTVWRLTQAAAIALIEAGSDEFHVKVDGQIVRLVVMERGGEKYLQTEREKSHPDDLLNLMFGHAHRPA